MTYLKSLFANPPFALPYLESRENNSFLHHFSEKAATFFSQLEASKQKDLGTYEKDQLLERVTFIIDQIKWSLKLYLEGYPAKAYNCFSSMIDVADLTPELIMRRTIQIPDKTVFYRIKKEYTPDAPAFNSKLNGFQHYLRGIDLFHVPFEKRRTIGTNRFSIPGYPSLYASESLPAAWSELGLSAADPFHAVALKNHRPLYIVDLAPVNCFTDADIMRSVYFQADPAQVYIDYAIIYPLILACHSKIKYHEFYTGEVKFRSEYIIPQLLLQWYREADMVVDGIRYLSCTAEDKFPALPLSKFNFVIPAHEYNEVGYCNSLLKNFSSTEVYTNLTPIIAKDIVSTLEGIMADLSSSPFSPLTC